MSDDDYSSEDYIEVVDQRPTSEREVRVEERDRVTFLAEDRMDPSERRELESHALEGAEEAEIYEESWTPTHSSDLDEIHDYIDHRLEQDLAEDEAPRRTRQTTETALRPGEAERLRRAIPGEIVAREVRYRTDSGIVVRVDYRGKDGDHETTLVSLGPEKVRFIDDIHDEVDDQPVEVDDLDLVPPEPPGETPTRRTRTEPETTTEPDEPDEPEETETEEAPEPEGETEAELEEALEEEPDEPEQQFSEEDLELAEELGIPPEELADITDEPEEESGGLGGLGLGGSDEEDADEGGSGGLGGLSLGGSGDEDDAEADEGDEGEAEGSGGLKGKLGLGKKKPEADDEPDEADEADDDEDEESGSFKDKLPFG